jgi:L-ascorbate metabolism protein UlaG (beta-lactamase superfamily)
VSDAVTRTPITITWIGHSTVLVEMAGVRVLTDPALTKSMAHLRRRHPVPPVPPVDVVAISHLHMDHLHRRSLRLVARAEAEIVMPAGSTSLLRGIGFGTVHEVGAGDDVDVERGLGTVHIDVVSAVHSGRRGPHSRLDAPALGYVIRAAGRSVYFAGDTALFAAMADIGEVDVALIPIWGWGATLGEHHLDPSSAASATALLQPQHVVPIHWGTYSPVRAGRGSPAWLDVPLERFRTALADQGLGDRLIPLLPGESITIG